MNCEHDISEEAQRNPSQPFYACFNFKILAVRKLAEEPKESRRQKLEGKKKNPNPMKIKLPW